MVVRSSVRSLKLLLKGSPVRATIARREGTRRPVCLSAVAGIARLLPGARRTDVGDSAQPSVLAVGSARRSLRPSTRAVDVIAGRSRRIRSLAASSAAIVISA